jgi:hypothetical protein
MDSDIPRCATLAATRTKGERLKLETRPTCPWLAYSPSQKYQPGSCVTGSGHAFAISTNRERDLPHARSVVKNKPCVSCAAPLPDCQLSTDLTAPTGHGSPHNLHIDHQLIVHINGFSTMQLTVEKAVSIRAAKTKFIFGPF